MFSLFWLFVLVLPVATEGAGFEVERSSGSAPQRSPSIRPCSRMEARVPSRFRIAPNMYCVHMIHLYMSKINCKEF